MVDFTQRRTRIITVVSVLVIIGGVALVIALRKSKSEPSVSAEKISAFSSPTPVPTKNQSTVTPTPSAIVTSVPTSTPIVTKPPTPSPTVTPTKAAPTSTPIPATNTPAPTNSPTPTNTPTPIPDTQPPQSRVLYPKNGGELTYKTNGQVCAISEGPLDNVSNWQKIQTRFKFDGDDWAAYETNRLYFCRDPLPNGTHTLKIQSKDEAGNEESEQTISFTVNIEGN